jgi:hypothetical protein
MIQPPPVDYALIKRQNQMLRDKIRNMLPEGATELDLLVQSLRVDQDYGSGGTPIRILSLGELHALLGVYQD